MSRFPLHFQDFEKTSISLSVLAVVLSVVLARALGQPGLGSCLGQRVVLAYLAWILILG